MSTKKEIRETIAEVAVHMMVAAERRGTRADCEEAVEMIYQYADWSSPIHNLLHEGGDPEFEACVVLAEAKFHEAGK